jgi:MFS family permease
MNGERDFAWNSIPAEPDRFDARQTRRAILAATIGNGLEFYDFVTFAFFAIPIGKTFFPSSSAYLSLMASLATFGAGFITRPLGAHVLGGYADRAGRRPAMMISMMLMGLGIVLLAITPGYAGIGFAAPLIAVTARLIQGFALGGEVGSASAYMLEASAPARRGRSISWQGVSQEIASAIGGIVGLVLSAVMSQAQLGAFGWRIALLLGASIVPVALIMRNALPETHSPATATTPGVVPFRGYARVIALGFVIIATGTITGYIARYMATYGQASLHLSSTVAFAGQTANAGISIVMALFGGWLCDRVGRRPAMIWPQLAHLIGIIPCFVWVTTARSATAFIGANVILAALGSSQYTAVYASVTESLPPAVRARAFALVYSVPVAVFGGTTQLVATWLLHVTNNPMSIAWYLTAIAAIQLATMLAVRESAPIKLGV